MRRKPYVSALTVVLATLLWWSLTVPAAAHGGHEHDRKIASPTQITQVILDKNADVVVGKHSVTSASPQSPTCPCCAGCSGCIGCCGLGASMTCAAGSAGHTFLASPFVADFAAGLTGLCTTRHEQRLAGRMVQPLDEPPRV